MSSQKVAIIGAGLAGTSLAYELSKNQNLSITIFDKNQQIATESSGNYAGIVRPYITNDNNYSEQFHFLGYELLLEFINKYRDKLDICSEGVLHLLSNDKELQRNTKIFSKRNISSDVAVLLDSQQTSKHLNITTQYSSVFYPNALSVIPKQLCKLWLELSNANLQLNTELKNITRLENKWLLDFTGFSQEFDIVIFAGAYFLFDKIAYLRNIPVYPSQGQLTLVDNVVNINITVMDKGYIIPNYKNSSQVIGATFRDNNDISGDIRDKDTQENIKHIEEIFSSESHSFKIIDERVATRCVTSDHLPLVGKLVDYDLFKEMFYKPLSKGYPKSKMPQVVYDSGLYLSSGFGSKGLCSSLASAQIISSVINNKEQQISQKLQDALSPQRFWVREFKKGAPTSIK